MTVEASVALVTVLFFGKVADQLDLRRLLDADILLQPGVRASIDRQVVDEQAMVRPGAEVAFFSLFSGG